MKKIITIISLLSISWTAFAGITCSDPKTGDSFKLSNGFRLFYLAEHYLDFSSAFGEMEM